MNNEFIKEVVKVSEEYRSGSTPNDYDYRAGFYDGVEHYCDRIVGTPCFDTKLTRITDINELKIGDKMYRVNGDGDVDSFEFVCIHPHNENYILALDTMIMDAKKIFIKNIIDSEWYTGEYDSVFFANKKMAYHIKMAKFYENRIKNGKKDF